MSMLSEPRRKQKIINLRAKNNAWSNDKTKFGQKMLEKMGWSAGKGLGAKEDGIVEHVIAKYKNDDKGLGFEDKNDQWTKHEDDFNSLLANLSNGLSSEEKLHSRVSLEQKSKKSKARVHYHKFTRGKDISRYSEKDLACIFGKKSLVNEDKVEEVSSEEIKVTDQVFTEKGSMEDYFKNKISSMKSVMKNESSLLYNDAAYDENFHFQGFLGTIDNSNENENHVLGFQSFSFYSNLDNVDNNDNHENKCSAKIKDNIVKTKSKKKKQKNGTENTDASECLSIDRSNRNKKDELKADILQPYSVDIETVENDIHLIKNVSNEKKKNKKKKSSEVSEELVQKSPYIKKKNKKKVFEEQLDSSINSEKYLIPKKRKKSDL